ncbi:MAG TPA: hypothetical protein DIS94_11270 [Bacteroidetes bacterium]|nr:hypothetical protein [Bacteroidota bacterium]
MIGCSSSEFKWDQHKEYFKIYVTEHDIFVKYKLYTIQSFDGSKFFLISEKRSEAEPVPFKYFELIRPGAYYKLELSKIDTIFILKSKHDIDNLYEDNILVWSNDTIRVPIYGSPSIYGEYIKMLK